MDQRPPVALYQTSHDSSSRVQDGPEWRATVARASIDSDRLFLLKPGFEDPDRPGHFYVCPHCNAIEGLLGSFPGLATQIEVHRLQFARPRDAIVDILGEEHQSLPVLVFDDTRPVPDDAKIANGSRFIDSSRRILQYLAERYAFPHLHD